MRNRTSSALISIPILVAGLLALWCPSLRAADVAARFDEANKLYEQGKYAEAARTYTEIVGANPSSATLHFNLGNALLKSDQIGRAIFNFRLAQRLAPRDPEVRANLQAARTTAKSTGNGPLPWLAWTRWLSLNEWTALAAAGFWSWLVLLAIGQALPRKRAALRKITLTVGVATLFLALWVTAFWYDEVASRPAVVVTEEAVIRLGPFEESQSSFSLHDGAEIKIKDAKAEWYQIRDRAGRIGWVRRDQVAELGG